ncbi:TPR repeat protein [Sulfurospirillum sp. 'SP']|nr:tetratricopeptide repeat protein [Sulfurospirillum sp. 'SP']WNY97956.1 TPR repeat protein [Sulfurospirillum sp. 'SP']
MQKTILSLIIIFLITVTNMYADALDMGLRMEKKGDYAQARKFHKQGCDQGNGDSCARLGYLMRVGWGLEERTFDDEGATKHYQKACDNNSTLGCYLLADSYESGLGINKDETKALGYYKKSCGMDGDESKFGSELLTANGCAHLARKFYDKEPKTAFQYAKKSCDNGNGEGCLLLARMYYIGNGIQKDKFKAVNFFRQVCYGDMGIAFKQPACTELGNLYAIEQSPQDALQAYKAACDPRRNTETFDGKITLSDECKRYEAYKIRVR